MLICSQRVAELATVLSSIFWINEHFTCNTILLGFLNNMGWFIFLNEANGKVRYVFKPITHEMKWKKKFEIDQEDRRLVPTSSTSRVPAITYSMTFDDCAFAYITKIYTSNAHDRREWGIIWVKYTMAHTRSPYSLKTSKDECGLVHRV